MDPVTDAGAQASRSLIEHGILGTLVVLLAVALVFAIRGWLKSKDAHLADKDRAAESAAKQATEAVQLASETNRVVDALNSSSEEIAAKIDALALATPGIDQAEYLRASRSRK